MNLTIVYRAYAGETDGKLNPVRTEWFSKFKCFKSFINEFGGKSKIIVLWDGEPEGDFYNYIKNSNVEIQNYGKLGNKDSLLKTYDILKQESCDMVGAMEDDYLFRKDCQEVIEEGYKMGFPLIAPYDCRERYLAPKEDHSFGQEYIFMGKKNYWRSCESTTGSCFFNKTLYDHILFDKLKLYNVNDRSFFRDILKSGTRLFSTMPGFSTHVCVDRGVNLMSPFVDWRAVNNSIVL